MLSERGLSVDHTTARRWVQRYAPEIKKRVRPPLKMNGTSYRLDKPYVRVGAEWEYLYRAVDSAGDTIFATLQSYAFATCHRRAFNSRNLRPLQQSNARHHAPPQTLAGR